VTDNKDLLKDEIKEKGPPCQDYLEQRNLPQHLSPGHAFACSLAATTIPSRRK
jgi:hypothetical protein